eukprot:7309265-Prymnesium_polylepis.1
MGEIYGIFCGFLTRCRRCRRGTRAMIVVSNYVGAPYEGNCLRILAGVAPTKGRDQGPLDFSLPFQVTANGSPA